MNKRLICLTLSILMLLTCVFTGCSSTKTEEEEESAVDNSAKTITMWVMTDDETTEKAKELVAEEFTKITKAKFKTNVILKFCTEDEYYEKLETAIEATQAHIELEEEAAKELRKYLKAHKGEKDPAELTKDFYVENPQYAEFQKAEEEEEDEDAPETEEETFVNDFGITELKYPEEKQNQVDIFYISGYEKYMQYNEAEWLSSLSEELSTSSKKLTDYISTSLLKGVEIEGSVYAIPNNVPIGEYTYMMIDKALFDRYYQKIDKIGSVLDLATFLNDVKNYNEENGKTEDDEGYVVPLASTLEDCLRMLCWYWDLSYIDRSVYEMYYDAERDRNYVLKKKFQVEVTSTDADGKETVDKVTNIVNVVAPDVVYKTNEAGQFVDAQGNALNYRYTTDPDGGWVFEDNKDPAYDESANAKGAMYLVDENGNPVTAENDRRVTEDAETKTDANGNARSTYYYAFDRDSSFSILGTMMKDAATRSRGEINLGFNSLFTDTVYHDMFATLMDYDYQNYFPENGEVKAGQTAAVSFMKGDARIKQTYEKDGVYVGEDGKEYYVIVAERPEATEEELYGNMYAVYANSPNLPRAMKVITYLNTNKEMRDLLQYGILDKHYEVTKDGIANVFTDANSQELYGTYRMDIRKTGNCFIATPDASLGADAWTYAKVQNNESLINPLLGFDFNTELADSDYPLDVVLIDHIAELNEQIKGYIDECLNKDELMALMSEGGDSLIRKLAPSSGDVKLNKATDPAYDPDNPSKDPSVEMAADPSGHSPYTVYQTWLNNYGYAFVPSAED